MVATKPRFVPESFLAGASCPLPTGCDDVMRELTPAERLVARYVAQGLSNKEISAVLGRAEPTIKHQLASTLRKLGVQSRCQLIVRLLRGPSFSFGVCAGKPAPAGACRVAPPVPTRGRS